MVRVLFLTDNPNLGSTARILQSWLPLAPRLGVQCAVVAPPGSKLLPWLAAENVPAISDSMPWPNRRWPFPGLWHAWRVARWARRQKIDLLHCNEHNVYPFALLVRRFLPRPMVCHVRFRLDPGFAHWAFSGIRHPAALLWTSRQQQADSAAAVEGLIPEERQHIVPLGLDLNKFGARARIRDDVRKKWGVRPDEIVIGQATALRPRKRIEDFVELIARLARDDRRIVGVLAGDIVPGDEEYRAKVLKQISDSGLGRRFVWLGNQDDIEPFYHGIDVFVSTSEYETFGNSVCEAMACRRPVAAYEGGSVREVVADSGIIVPTGSLDELTVAVRGLVENQPLAAALGESGRRRVADVYDPARSLGQLRDIYHTICQPTQRGSTHHPGESQCPMTQTLHS